MEKIIVASYKMHLTLDEIKNILALTKNTKDLKIDELSGHVIASSSLKLTEFLEIGEVLL